MDIHSCSVNHGNRAGVQLARLGAAGAFLAVVDVPVGSCAQAQGQGLPPPLGRGRGGGVAGSLTPR